MTSPKEFLRNKRNSLFIFSDVTTKAGSSCPICFGANVTDDKGSKGLQGYSQISMRLKPLLKEFKIEVSVGFHDKEFVKKAESRINELNMSKEISCYVRWENFVVTDRGITTEYQDQDEGDVMKRDDNYLVTVCRMTTKYQDEGHLIESLAKFYRMTCDWKPWKLTSLYKVIQAVHKLMTMIEYREFSYDLDVIDHKCDIIIKNKLLPSKKYDLTFSMNYDCWTCLSEIVIMICGKKVDSFWAKGSGYVSGLVVTSEICKPCSL